MDEQLAQHPKRSIVSINVNFGISAISPLNTCLKPASVSHGVYNKKAFEKKTPPREMLQHRANSVHNFTIRSHAAGRRYSFISPVHCSRHYNVVEAKEPARHQREANACGSSELLRPCPFRLCVFPRREP